MTYLVSPFFVLLIAARARGNVYFIVFYKIRS
nr:hypothetical protein UPHDAKEK_UPHDAKEK_CDS_0004 [Microvirus sp.]